MRLAFLRFPPLQRHPGQAQRRAGTGKPKAPLFCAVPTPHGLEEPRSRISLRSSGMTVEGWVPVNAGLMPLANENLRQPFHEMGKRHHAFRPGTVAAFQVDVAGFAGVLKGRAPGL